MALLYRPTLGVGPGEREGSDLRWWDTLPAVVMQEVLPKQPKQQIQRHPV